MIWHFNLYFNTEMIVLRIQKKWSQFMPQLSLKGLATVTLSYTDLIISALCLQHTPFSAHEICTEPDDVQGALCRINVLLKQAANSVTQINISLSPSRGRMKIPDHRKANYRHIHTHWYLLNLHNLRTEVNQASENPAKINVAYKSEKIQLSERNLCSKKASLKLSIHLSLCFSSEFLPLDFSV